MISLLKDEKAAIVLAAIAIVVIIIGIYTMWWELSAILEYIQQVMLGGIVGVLLWGFRKRIKNAFEQVLVLPTTKAQSITKELGKPDTIGNGIQIYHRRSHLPFDEFLAEAHQRVDMLAVTFHCITTSHIGLIEDTVYRGIRVTFLILNPNSKYAENRKEDFHEGEEVKHHIDRSLHVLCDLKKRLKDEYKDSLVIKTYEHVINESIIIIDNRLIKIEKHQKGSDSGSRLNELAFNNDNQSFFQRYSQHYQKIKPMDYACSE